MRYLLDEMYPASAAGALRRRGIDTLAVQDFADLSGLPDADLFAVAQLDVRTLVTENAQDLLWVEAVWRRDIGRHWGLVLTSNRSFPRHDVAMFIRRFATGLAHADQEMERLGSSFVVWLRPRAPRST